MKPLSEWEADELRAAVLQTPGPVDPDLSSYRRRVLDELLRRERVRCADEVGLMLGNWSDEGECDWALASAEARIRGME